MVIHVLLSVHAIVGLLQVQLTQLLPLPLDECMNSVAGQSPFLFLTRRFWNLLIKVCVSLRSFGTFRTWLNLPNLHLLFGKLQSRCNFDAAQPGEILIRWEFTLQFQQLGGRKCGSDSLAGRVRVVVCRGWGWRAWFRGTWVHRSFTQVVGRVKASFRFTFQNRWWCRRRSRWDHYVSAWCRRIFQRQGPFVVVCSWHEDGRQIGGDVRLWRR